MTEATSGALPSNNMSDSIQALRDSAEKLRSEKGALPVSSKPTVAELRRKLTYRNLVMTQMILLIHHIECNIPLIQKVLD